MRTLRVLLSHCNAATDLWTLFHKVSLAQFAPEPQGPSLPQRYAIARRLAGMAPDLDVLIRSGTDPFYFWSTIGSSHIPLPLLLSALSSSPPLHCGYSSQALRPLSDGTGFVSLPTSVMDSSTRPQPTAPSSISHLQILESHGTSCRSLIRSTPFPSLIFGAGDTFRTSRLPSCGPPVDGRLCGLWHGAAGKSGRCGPRLAIARGHQITDISANPASPRFCCGKRSTSGMAVFCRWSPDGNPHAIFPWRIRFKVDEQCWPRN